MTGLDSSSEVAHPIATDVAQTRAATTHVIDGCKARGKGCDMKNLWYVSVASASTAAAPRRMPDPHLTRTAARALLAVAVSAVAACRLSIGCSGSVASGSAGRGVAGTADGAGETGRARRQSGRRALQGWGALHVPQPLGDVAEAPPPDEQHKRFEIRLAGGGGGATLDSPTLGHFAAGTDETCFYIDVLPGTTSDVVFTATEAQKEGGHRAAALDRGIRTQGPVVVRRRSASAARVRAASATATRRTRGAWRRRAASAAASTPADRR